MAGRGWQDAGKCTGPGSSPRLSFTTYEGDSIRSALLFVQHPLLPGPLPMHMLTR